MRSRAATSARMGESSGRSGRALYPGAAQQGITNCAGPLLPTPGAASTYRMAGVYTLAEYGPGILGTTAEGDAGDLVHDRLDHSAVMFAPWLLGCPVRPGSTRYPERPADAYDRAERQVPAGVGIARHQVMEKNQTDQRTLNPRVRGSSPWRRTRSDLGFHDSRSFFSCPFCPLGCSVVARAHGPSNPGLVKNGPSGARCGGIRPGTAPSRRSVPPRVHETHGLDLHGGRRERARSPHAGAITQRDTRW
jgi:hypothetical protein